MLTPIAESRTARLQRERSNPPTRVKQAREKSLSRASQSAAVRDYLPRQPPSAKSRKSPIRGPKVWRRRSNPKPDPLHASMQAPQCVLPDASADAGKLAENTLPTERRASADIGRCGTQSSVESHTRPIRHRSRCVKCDLTLAAGDVSAQHCELRREGQWWTIADSEQHQRCSVSIGKKVSQQMLVARR